MFQCCVYVVVSCVECLQKECVSIDVINFVPLLFGDSSDGGGIVFLCKMLVFRVFTMLFLCVVVGVFVRLRCGLEQESRKLC